MHTIRLRYPWTRQARSGESCRIDVPEPMEFASNIDEATYSRRFNRPTGLEEGDRVWLRISSWQGTLTSLRLNETEQSIAGTHIELDITEQMKLHNLIEIALSPSDTNQARLDGEVTIEIRRDR